MENDRRVEKSKRSTSNKNSEHDKSSQIRDTADVIAVIRYHESKKGKPLVNDPFAHLFTSSQGEEILESALKRWPFFLEYLVVRTKFFDDHLKNFCEKEGVKQIVILGSGSDMRAVRLPFMKRKKIFEVDFPDQIINKKDILKKSLVNLPKNVSYLGINLKESSLIKVLNNSGFLIKDKAAFILEGLIYYLTPEGVDHLFEELSYLPPSGTFFLLDQIG